MFVPKYPVPDKPASFGRKRPAKRQGGSATLRDTSAAYKRRREHILALEPLCRYCRNRDGRIVPATILDHLVALALGGSNDPANLVPACRPCNAAKAIDEQRFIARGYNAADLALDHAMGDWLRLASIFQKGQSGGI